MFLIPHSPQPEPLVRHITASISRTVSGLSLSYTLAGSIGALAIPSPLEPVRRDGLWRHTCFEAFVQQDHGSYWEFNFSPSGEWAAYSFSDYRKDMVPLDVEPPELRFQAGDEDVLLNAELCLPRFPDHVRISLTAIVEELSGRKSYWALAHPPGEPDFHHPACFALELPPPSAP